MLPYGVEERASKKRSVASLENRGCASNSGHGCEEKHGRWDRGKRSTVLQKEHKITVKHVNITTFNTTGIWNCKMPTASQVLMQDSIRPCTHANVQASHSLSFNRSYASNSDLETFYLHACPMSLY